MGTGNVAADGDGKAAAQTGPILPLCTQDFGARLWGQVSHCRVLPVQGTVAQLQLFPYHSSECFSLSGCFVGPISGNRAKEAARPCALFCAQRKFAAEFPPVPLTSRTKAVLLQLRGDELGMAQHFVIIWDLTKLGGTPRAGRQQANPMVSITFLAPHPRHES